MSLRDSSTTVRPSIGALVERSLAAAADRPDGFDAAAGAGLAWAAADDRHLLRILPARQPVRSVRGRSAGPPDTLGAGGRVRVVTNGPMMGKRLAGRLKMNGRRSMVHAALTAATVAAAGLGVGAATGRPRVGAAVGAVTGAAIGPTVALGRWAPCGVVRGAEAGIDDGRDFDGEGSHHGWIARVDGERTGQECARTAIGRGHPPDDSVEAAGGLAPLIIDGVAIGYELDHLNPDTLEKRGVVVWCRAPSPTTGAAMTLCVGGAELRTADVVALLLDLGVTDAVATDQRRSAALAIDGEDLVGPPPWWRRRVEGYRLTLVVGE